MKKLLVPTDFSAPAENAARYALQLARCLHTGIELCHAFKVLMEMTGAVQIVWPLANYGFVKQQATNDLSILSGNLEQNDRAANDGKSYYPAVSCTSEAGTVLDMVRNTGRWATIESGRHGHFGCKWA